MKVHISLKFTKKMVTTLFATQHPESEIHNSVGYDYMNRTGLQLNWKAESSVLLVVTHLPYMKYDNHLKRPSLKCSEPPPMRNS